MPRRAKNGRFTKTSSTRRRRTPKKVNLGNALQNYLVLDAMTKGFFGTSAINFATEGWLRDRTSGADFGAGNSWTLSASELIQSALGDSSHMSSQWQGMGGVSASVKHNLKRNGAMMAFSLIAIPVAFKYGRKILGKSLIRPANRLLAPAGVKL